MARTAKKIEFDGHTFDSNEEVEFYQWILEAKRVGLIESFTHPCKSYVLSNAVSVTVERVSEKTGKPLEPKESSLLQRHVYTPDFKIKFTDKAVVLPIDFRCGLACVFDVKGTFSIHEENRVLGINIKWMYLKYGVLVQKVVPEKLFVKTWCPAGARLTPKKRQPRKKYLDVPTVEQFVERVVN